MGNLKQFTVRVYGILVHNNKILISHERYKKKAFSKFPGGGLKLGEGVINGLKREFKEEMDIEIEPSYLFHVTESLQISRFDNEKQVIALYYIVQSHETEKIPILNKEELHPNKGEVFEWIELNAFKNEMLSFESDREAAQKLFGKEPLKF